MNILRDLRVSRNMTQENLSRLTGLTLNTIGRYERYSVDELRKASVNRLCCICDALQVDRSYFFNHIVK